MENLERGRREWKPGFTSYCEMNGKHSNMLMDFGILEMKAGMRHKECMHLERAYILVYGEVRFTWDKKSESAYRKNCFDDPLVMLHVSNDAEVEIEAISPKAEIAIIRTDNATAFESRLYRTGDVPDEHRGKGTMQETGTRIVRTPLDKKLAPWSNFVMGEVINYPGRWSSYPPHDHPQPEVYYYKMTDPELGYGFSELGDRALKIHNNDVLYIDAGTHPQVAAPGFGMWYLWVIRHLDDKPYITPDFLPEYLYITKETAFWPEKKLADWSRAETR